MRFVLSMVLVAAMLSGCASGGPKGRKVLSASIAPQKSRLVIYRISILGFAVQPSYMVDGKTLAPSQPKGFVVCHLRPGKHRVSVNNFKVNVNFGGGRDKLTVNMRQGRTTYIKADIQVGLTVGVITLTEVSENQGRYDTANLHKIASGC